MKRRVLVRILAMKLDLSQSFDTPAAAESEAVELVRFLEDLEVLSVEPDTEPEPPYPRGAF